MTLIDYINSLSAAERAAYATRCGTTVNYLLIRLRYARREPRPRLRRALADQSNGKVTYADVLAHFGIIDFQSISSSAIEAAAAISP